MQYDDLDRILSEQGEIIPSPGFVRAVMTTVLRESATPPPVPFPWKLGLTGSLSSIMMLLLLPRVAAPTPAAGSDLNVLLDLASNFEAGWIAVALLLPFALVAISLRLARVGA